MIYRIGIYGAVGMVSRRVSGDGVWDAVYVYVCVCVYVYVYVHTHTLEFSCRYPSTDDRLVA